MQCQVPARLADHRDLQGVPARHRKVQQGRRTGVSGGLREVPVEPTAAADGGSGAGVDDQGRFGAARVDQHRSARDGPGVQGARASAGAGGAAAAFAGTHGPGSQGGGAALPGDDGRLTAGRPDRREPGSRPRVDGSPPGGLSLGVDELGAARHLVHQMGLALYPDKPAPLGSPVGPRPFQRGAFERDHPAAGGPERHDVAAGHQDRAAVHGQRQDVQASTAPDEVGFERLPEGARLDGPSEDRGGPHRGGDRVLVVERHGVDRGSDGQPPAAAFERERVRQGSDPWVLSFREPEGGQVAPLEQIAHPELASPQARRVVRAVRLGEGPQGRPVPIRDVHFGSWPHGLTADGVDDQRVLVGPGDDEQRPAREHRVGLGRPAI